MKTNKNQRQLQLDQRTYYAAAFRATNQAITFWILLLCNVLISNTSKNDNVAGSANNSNVLINKIAVCFTTYSSSWHSW